jgi:carbamoyl-phosphate synthase large subunit
MPISKETQINQLREKFFTLKSLGFSDAQFASALGIEEVEVRKLRHKLGIEPVYKMIDTCAAEFESFTPYYYSTYEAENEALDSQKDKVIILGGGPNRIGQGIEFDYCCVHASMALREAGYETIMVNSNPETVSTDFDSSDKLYFEPVTVEDVLAIWNQEKPLGVIVQIGGQTPLNIAEAIEKEGVKILGTSVAQIARAENRYEFNTIVNKLKLNQPPSEIADEPSQVIEKAHRVGYPVLVRPSFVLGGQSMQIVYSDAELNNWLSAMEKSGIVWPVLIDKFLDDAIEIDVDAVSDGKEVLVAGILEHIERAGIHSGDSSCVLPSYTLSDAQIDELIKSTELLAKELGVIGLINVQYAFKEGKLYVLEVNPRASRTVPFVSKATGIPFAKIGALLMVGNSLESLREKGILPKFTIKEFMMKGLISVKEAVLPFKKFPGCQIALGPEMRSTGEVMGIAETFGIAFAKAQIAAGQNLSPKNKTVFLSVNDSEKDQMLEIAKILESLDYSIYSTEGTFNYLKEKGIQSTIVRKAKDPEPNILNLLTERKISLLINIPKGLDALQDNMSIRRLAILLDLPLITTMAGAKATAEALKSYEEAGRKFSVKSLQEYHPVC